MAVSRRDFAGWYLNQNLYPRPHPDVIWPPALIPSNSDLPKPVPSGAAVDSPAEAVKSGSTVAAETKCAAWLAALMQAGPPGKAKAAYQLEALDKFPVGSRAFARAWDKAKSDVGAALAAPWQKPGRKS